MPASASDLEESDVMLAQVARLDLELARDLHARALATEDNTEAAMLARAYQGVTRSMRQALVVLARLKDGRARAAREARPRRDEGRIGARHAVVREAVRRVMFHETDEDDHDRHWDWIEGRLRYDELPDDFADHPLDAQIVGICAEMGIDREAAGRWRDAPGIDYMLADEDDPDVPSDSCRPVFGWTTAEPRAPAIANSG